jgi:putative transposase
MNTKRTYFGMTRSSQRKLLFETWQATGHVAEACRRARVSRGLFYYWKPRFDERGLAGLEEFASRAAHNRHVTPEPIAQQVIALRRQHPDWGKVRISQELAKAKSWVPVVSPNTVKRILRDAGLWPGEARKNRWPSLPAAQNSQGKP